MRSPVLPIMGVMTVIAGAVGLQLGESAIAQIDPIHFLGAAERPRDVTRDGPPQRDLAYADASGWEQGFADRAADCGDCTAMIARQAPAVYDSAPMPAEDAPAQGWVYATAQEEALADEARIERSIQASRMKRYLHYPINADQAQVAQAMNEDAPLPPEPQTDEPASL